jgi:hypothetical protein
MTFDTDEFKNDRLRLSDQIRKRMEEDAIQYTGQLFHDMIYVYTESQQWTDCAKLLRMQQDRRQCDPSIKTMTYLKQNLVYCFQNNTRMDVQDAIDNFELRFFSYQQRKDSGATFNQKRRRQ